MASAPLAAAVSVSDKTFRGGQVVGLSAYLVVVDTKREKRRTIAYPEGEGRTKDLFFVSSVSFRVGGGQIGDRRGGRPSRGAKLEKLGRGSLFPR